MEGGISAELESKRFVITKEQGARSKLDVFQQALQTARTKHPEIIGATLFGSMTKNTTHEGSDIDTFVFVDLDQIKSTFTPDEYQRAEQWIQEEKQLEPRFVAPPIEDAIATLRYKPLIVEPLIAVGMQREQMRDVRVRVLSRDFLRQEIEHCVENTNQRLAWEEAVRLQEKKDGNFYEWLGNNPKPEPYFADWKLSAIFHLSLGKDLQGYRKFILDTLKGYGQVGDIIWKKDVIGATADMERNLRGESYSYLYPQNVEAAEKYFHLSAPIKSKVV